MGFPTTRYLEPGFPDRSVLRFHNGTKPGIDLQQVVRFLLPLSVSSAMFTSVVPNPALIGHVTGRCLQHQGQMLFNQLLLCHYVWG